MNIVKSRLYFKVHTEYSFPKIFVLQLDYACVMWPLLLYAAFYHIIKSLFFLKRPTYKQA